jgi:hypothetical protein
MLILFRAIPTLYTFLVGTGQGRFTTTRKKYIYQEYTDMRSEQGKDVLLPLEKNIYQEYTDMRSEQDKEFRPLICIFLLYIFFLVVVKRACPVPTSYLYNLFVLLNLFS